MALLPKVKLKAMLSFPSAILDGAGIDVTRVNGAFRFDLAYDDFTPPVSGIADPAHTNALLWNSATNAYVLAPVSILGSAGTVPEAPSDGVQYGRQSNTWTPVATGSTIPPATVPPLMDGAAAVGTTTKYAREDHVHPSDTSRAPVSHSHVAANVTDFSEAVDDRVGSLLQAGSNITLTYDDPGNALTIASTAAGMTDGDKGDITVSGSGTTWTIDPNTVSNAKLAQMPLFTIKANNTGGAASPTDINIASLTPKTPAGADYLLLSDTSASGALKKTLISAMPGGTSIGEAPLDGALYSRQGSTGSWAVAGGFPDGNKGDITITSSGTVWTINADAVTFAKIQNIATDSLIGRDTAGTGDPENITLGTSLSMSGAQVLRREALTGDVTATVDSNTTTIANGAVTLAKMANLTAPVFVGRTTTGAGVPEALSPTQATAMLNVFASSLKGLVPSPAGATTTFLQADGTWAAPVDSTKVAKAGDTMTGNLIVNKASPVIELRKSASGQDAMITGSNGGSARWTMSFGSSISESGGNIGSDFVLYRYKDDGSFGGIPFNINRSDGLVFVEKDPTQPLGVATKQYVDAGDVAGLAAAGMQINGGMEIDQPNAGASVTPANGNSKSIDGWGTYRTGTSVVTVQQVASVFPGYNSELKFTVTTAQSSIGSDVVIIQGFYEGYRIARAGWGTTAAKPITVGFWVKSSVAGSFNLQFTDGTNTAVASPVITSANTAQFITAVLPAQTTWAGSKTNGLGATLNIFIAGASQINILATVGNTFEITGFVVLPGALTITAAQSPLLMRSYDQELVTCQRYWQKMRIGVQVGAATNTLFYGAAVNWPLRMRSTPTFAMVTANIGGTTGFAAGLASFLGTSDIGGMFYKAATVTGNAAFLDEISLDARL
jgi:hypothetical protein